MLDLPGRVYLSRQADQDLLDRCCASTFAYVLTFALTFRQMGKSSFMVRTAERLQGEGIQTVVLDLTDFTLREAEPLA